MVSKETKIFALFFILFSILIFFTSWVKKPLVEAPTSRYSILKGTGSVRVEFAGNWTKKNRRGEEERIMVGPSEVHIFNPKNKTQVKRINFKGLSGEEKEKTLRLFYRGEYLDEVDLGKRYRFYQTPALHLKPGENVLKFNSPGNFQFYKFYLKDVNLEDSEGVYFGKDWYPVENWYHQSKSRYLKFHWMDQNGTLRFYNQNDENINRTLGLEISSFNRPRKLEIYLNGSKVSERDVNLLVEEGKNEIRIENLSFRPGDNLIRLHSVEGCQVPAEVKGNEDDRCLSFALWSANIYSGLDTESKKSNLEGINQYHVLLAILAFVVVSLGLNIGKLNFFKKIDKKLLLITILVFLAAFSLRITGPRTYQLYLDEPWNVHVAKNIYKGVGPQLCSYTAEKAICENFYKPAGFPFYLSLLFTIFGFSLSLVFWNSVVLGTLSCILVFILLYIITRREKMSALASILFAVLPVHIFWSTTAESYVTSFFFILLTFILFYKYQESEDLKILLLLLSVTLFTVTMRIENIFLLALLPVVAYLEKGDIDLSIIKKKGTIVAISVVSLFLISYYRIFTDSLTYYREVTKILTLNITLSPIYIALIAVVGVIVSGFVLMWKRNKRLLKLSLPWILIISPSFIFKTGTLRMFTPLFLVFSFSASELISSALERFKDEKYTKFIYIGLCISIVALAFFIPKGYSNTQEKLLQTGLIDEAREEIPSECYVIVEHPSILTGVNKKIIGTAYALDNPRKIDKLASDSCVLFYEGIGCKTDFRRGAWARHCDKMHKVYELEPYKNYTRDEIKYTFYRVGHSEDV